jgi:hypothetical protein
MDEAGFANHIEMQEYAERNGLDYTWSGTPSLAKRKRTLPADQFEVRAVRTRRASRWSGSSRRPSPGQSGRPTRRIGRRWRRSVWRGSHGHVDGPNCECSCSSRADRMVCPCSNLHRAEKGW